MPASRIIELRNQGELRLYEGSNGDQKITLKAPASLAADLTFQLPDVAGSANQFLQTNGAGVLSWAAGASTLQQAYDASSPPTITIGAGGTVIINDADGGEVLRLSSTTSGNPFLSVKAATGELRILQTNAGAAQIGTFSNHNLEIRTNNATRITVLNTGEIGIGTAAVVSVPAKLQGVLWATTGVVVDNNLGAFRAFDFAGLSRPVLSVTSGDHLVLGDSGFPAGKDVQVPHGGSTGRMVLGVSTTTGGKLDIQHATDCEVVVRTTDSPTTSHEQSVIFSTGTGTPGNANQTGELKAVITTASPLKSELRHRINFGATMTDALIVKDGEVVHTGQHGQQTREIWTSVVTGTLSGTTVTVVNFIPAGAILVGVTTRVQTDITGTGLTSFDVGITGFIKRFVNGSVNFTAGSTTNSATNSHGDAHTSVPFYPAATNVVITAQPSASFTGGTLRLVLHYFLLSTPTS